MEETQKSRSFAAEHLNVSGTKNYTTFVETDKKYLAAIDSASEEFSCDPFLWHFPIVGSVPYKGFFAVEKAVKEAESFKKKGYDTWIRGVDAFSTLGFFSDPLYSFMVDYSQYAIAELIIHEQVHATIWVKNSPSFNEELASFIGEQGAKEYIEQTYGSTSEQYLSIAAQKHDGIIFKEDMLSLKTSLKQLYAQAIPPEQMRGEKREIIQNFQEQFSNTYAERYSTENYKGVSEIPINNAYVALFEVYGNGSTLVSDLYDHLNGDLPALIEALKPLHKTKLDPKVFIQELMNR